MNETYTIGIDIGGTNFRIGAVDEGYNPHHFRKVPVSSVFRSSDPLSDLEGYLTDYLQILHEEGKRVNRLVFGFPAVLDRKRQVVLQAPNIPFMENLPVVDALKARLGMEVFIERDVSIALCYDKYRYHLPDCEVLAGCYFGTGIGNALMVYGRPLLGRNGTAGELGHIPVDGSQEICGCGNAGCLENLAGGKYLAKLCETTYTDCSIGEIFLKHGEELPLRQFVDRLAIAVATELNILNPDYMIIGGGVPWMAGFPRDFLTERIRARCRKPYPSQDLPLIYAEDTKDKCIIGAAFYADMIQGRFPAKSEYHEHIHPGYEAI